MKKWSMLFAAAVFLFVAIPADRAEAQVTFGPQVVLWDFEDLGVGARVDFALGEAFGLEDGVMSGLTGSFNGNYLFDDSDFDITTLVFNLNGLVPLHTDGALAPFVGLGLNHLRSSFEGFSATSTGLNVLGGLNLNLGDIPAFVELQYSTTGSGFASLSFGVMFGG